MCSFLSTAGVPRYFPCKLNPLKHHSHLQPCSFRYLTPVQICLEFKMILPNTFHQSAPLPLFGKDWKETETPQSPGVNYLTSLMVDHSILPSNPEKYLNNINSAGAPNLRSGVPCQGPIDCSTSLTKSRNLLSWYQECGRRSVEQKTNNQSKTIIRARKSKVNGAKMKMLTHNTSRSRKFHTFSEPAQWME